MYWEHINVKRYKNQIPNNDVVLILDKYASLVYCDSN